MFLVPRSDPFSSVTDLDAAMFRALVCSNSIAGLKWIRTYYTPGVKTSWCVFEANSAEDIAAYSRLANIPYDDIIEVAEITRDAYWSPEPEEDRVLSESR
jgi:hypothetical protein